MKQLLITKFVSSSRVYLTNETTAKCELFLKKIQKNLKNTLKNLCKNNLFFKFPDFFISLKLILSSNEEKIVTVLIKIVKIFRIDLLPRMLLT